MKTTRITDMTNYCPEYLAMKKADLRYKIGVKIKESPTLSTDEKYNLFLSFRRIRNIKKLEVMYKELAA